MKNLDAKFKWYNIVIIVGICIFSFLCWIKYARNVVSILISYVETSTVIEKEQSENTEADSLSFVEVEEVPNLRNKLCGYIEVLDGYIDNIDSTWYNNMFIKAYLSKIDIIYTYLSTRESSQVLKGKGNWLFYKRNTDGNPIADYEGTNRYSLTEEKNILEEALITQKELNARNIKFTILVAPNKENIYSEYMPDMYTHTDISSTDILIDYLAENGVNIVSPKQELLDNHDEFQLYYSYDTHWNQLGAYIGVKNVLESWNISKPILAERSILSYNLAGNYHYCGVDDLAKMVGMRSFLYNDEKEYEVEGTGVMDWKEFEDEQNNNEVSYFYNSDAQINANILLVGDSFRTSMIPSLRETFSDVYVVHRSYYTADLLDEIEPEYLIAEYVERYSSNIGKISSLIK